MKTLISKIGAAWTSFQRKAEVLWSDRELLWKRFRDFALLVGGAIPVTILLGGVGLFKELETPVLDLQSKIRPARSGEGQIVIIRITNEDYKNIFHGKSPLDPAKLHSVIDAIARCKPKVIGVDIDTSAAEFREMAVSPEWPRVVWARDAIYSNTKKRYYPLGLRGLDAPNSLSGVIAYPMDQDDVVRRYTRIYNTELGLLPSFPYAVAKAFSPENAGRLKESGDELLINYADRPARFSIPSSQILAIGDRLDWMAGKIVILGGDYAVQDEHDTPLGWRLGVEVLAQTIETELEGGGLRVPSKIRVMFIATLTSVALWLFLLIWRPRRLALLGFIVIPALAFICSYIAFRSPSQWGYFLPILIAVLIHQVIERFKEAGVTDHADKS